MDPYANYIKSSPPMMKRQRDQDEHLNVSMLQMPLSVEERKVWVNSNTNDLFPSFFFFFQLTGIVQRFKRCYHAQ